MGTEVTYACHAPGECSELTDIIEVNSLLDYGIKLDSKNQFTFCVLMPSLTSTDFLYVDILCEWNMHIPSVLQNGNLASCKEFIYLFYYLKYLHAHLSAWHTRTQGRKKIMLKNTKYFNLKNIKTAH